MTKTINLIKLGIIPYNKGLLIQEYYVRQLKSQILNKINADTNHLGTLILLQHNPVYTIGLRNLKEYDTNLEIKLKNLGADFYKTNRGGLITFHGPGQLIAYPIINLKIIKPSIKWYICNLEKTIIELCKQEFNLNVGVIPKYTGVWVNESKLCAIGVHSSLYITHHGLALNCNTDLDWFKHIIPCGIENKNVTCLSELLGRNVSVESIQPLFIKHFENVFQCRSNHVELEKEIKPILIS